MRSAVNLRRWLTMLWIRIEGEWSTNRTRQVSIRVRAAKRTKAVEKRVKGGKE